jgi:CHC2 zinc finger
MSFIDFAEKKARCSIEQAAKLLDLKTTEERSQLRAPCPVCGGGPRAIVITPAKNLFHCFPSKAGGDQIALVSHVKGVSQKDAAALMLGQQTQGTVQSNGTSTSTYKTSSPRLIISKPTTSQWKRSGCPKRQPNRWGLDMCPRA